MIGVGSQYAAAVVGSRNQPLDSGKTYKLHLPPDIPAKDFWSLVLYENHSRSLLQTTSGSEHQQPEVGRGGQPRHIDGGLFRFHAPLARRRACPCGSTVRSSRGSTRHGSSARSRR
nr:DUF1214 domain-containing protein [Nordella sp. HKS 07]